MFLYLFSFKIGKRFCGWPVNNGSREKLVAGYSIFRISLHDHYPSSKEKDWWWSCIFPGGAAELPSSLPATGTDLFLMVIFMFFGQVHSFSSKDTVSFALLRESSELLTTIRLSQLRNFPAPECLSSLWRHPGMIPAWCPRFGCIILLFLGWYWTWLCNIICKFVNWRSCPPDGRHRWGHLCIFHTWFSKLPRKKF